MVSTPASPTPDLPEDPDLPPDPSPAADLAEAAPVAPPVEEDPLDPETFDRYARLVQHGLDVPVSLVSIVEADRQWFPGMVGLPEPWATCRETPLSHSFCQHVVADRTPLVVRDARQDPRVADNLAIDDLGVIAYAGYPITDHTGAVIGSLCAIDGEPRDWDPAHLDVLADLAAACSAEISERGMRLLAREETRRAHDLSERSRVLLALSEGLAEAQTTVDVAVALARTTTEQLGCLRAGIWLRPPDRALSLDRGLSGAPESGDLYPDVVGETLTFVSWPGHAWEAALEHAHFPIATDNPIGACLLAGAPVYYDSRAQQTARFPHIRSASQIGEARAFLPLTTRTQVYGVLVLLWEDQVTVSEAQRMTLEALAVYTSQALQRTLLFQDRMDALVTLQSALMPRLPSPDALTLAARYRPAATLDQIGGDWFDAVVMPGGRTALMIGDVIGHDIAAAAKMGQVRSMLRAFALAVSESPSRSVGRLDRALQDLEMQTMASLVYGQIVEADPDEGGGHTLHWTNAGHPPPLLVCDDGSVEWLGDWSGADGDALVGVAPEQERTDHVTDIPPGTTLLLYTDGLVERRGEDLEEGLARLGRSALAHRDLDTEAFLDAVLADLVDTRLTDDIALLAVRFA